ncbi:MAG: HlyD family efflux transporter periplasmic adaptor subunit [Gammaproteobacteria bacterium]|nr:HlyD family efflux transporter periplasmic adaptor subunit [Gammaproteobacteria bacterium]MBU1629192.1 HlyD family efflux transporter periplasmic adaptor subunit [Gammaproteobacteria bacterium]
MKSKTQWLLALIALLSTTLLPACHFNDPNIRQGYVEGRFTYVSSQVGGTLEKINVTRGDDVKAEQALFQLETDPQLATFHRAEADLQQAKSQLANLQKGKRPSELAAIEAQQKQVIAQIKFSEKTVERYQQLVKQHLLQQEKLDEVVSQYHNQQQRLNELRENLKTAKLKARVDEVQAAQANVQAATASLKRASWELDQKTITAPVTGIVFDTYFREGEVVNANQPVLSLLAPENIYIVLFVPEKQLARIKKGHPLHFTCDNCQKTFQATVSYISPEAEYTPPVIYSEKSRSKLVYRIEGRLSLEEAKTLHPGQPITVTIP